MNKLSITAAVGSEMARKFDLEMGRGECVFILGDEFAIADKFHTNSQSSPEIVYFLIAKAKG